MGTTRFLKLYPNAVNTLTKVVFLTDQVPFILVLGCLEIAEEFRSQEIDGQALLLLKEDHLMGTMNIKLGPALKIFAQISMLRDS